MNLDTDTTMKVSPRKVLLAEEINKVTRTGADELQKGNLRQALENFQYAFKRAIQYKNPRTERTCSFNLGAVFIAVNEPQKGLKLLHRAVPPINVRDGQSNGDLFYNYGLAYDILKDTDNTIKYFSLALEEYKHEENNFKMEADVSDRLGHLYVSSGKFQQAADNFGHAAEKHCSTSEITAQTKSLCQQTEQLIALGQVEEAIAIINTCLVNTNKIVKAQDLGKVYCDVGLLYAKCKEFPKAAECFEFALPLSREVVGQKQTEAVVLQNLGAMYNSLGDYQRSLHFHEEAITKHAELSNRKSQGQCFLNLAFAFTQLKDMTAAGEAFLHALQASKDSANIHAQWQALEGLGAVSFNKGDKEKSVWYFKQALTAVSSSPGDQDSQGRIMIKLTDAIRWQVNHETLVPMMGHASATLSARSSLQADVRIPKVALNDELKRLSQLEVHKTRRSTRHGHRRPSGSISSSAISLGLKDPNSSSSDDDTSALSDSDITSVTSASDEEEKKIYTKTNNTMEENIYRTSHTDGTSIPPQHTSTPRNNSTQESKNLDVSPRQRRQSKKERQLTSSMRSYNMCRRDTPTMYSKPLLSSELSSSSSISSSGSSDEDSDARNGNVVNMLSDVKEETEDPTNSTKLGNNHISSSEDGASSSEDDIIQSRTLPPVPDPLSNTYETPVDVHTDPSEKSHSPRHYSNYFNPTYADYKQEHSDDIEYSKESSDEEPLYATIKGRTGELNLHQRRGSHTSGLLDVPDRSFSNMTKAEKEIFLYEKQREMDNENGVDVQLPVRNSKNKSRACTIM